MKSLQEPKLKDGAKPFLQACEEVLAAFVTRPRIAAMRRSPCDDQGRGRATRRANAPGGLLAAAAIAAAAFAATGCGESSSFIDQYNHATKPLQQLTRETGAGAPVTSHRRLRSIADELDAVAVKLRRLHPPADARDELQRLVAAIGSSATGIRLTANAARAGYPQRLLATSRRLERRGTELARAEQALKAAVGAGT